MRTTLAAGLLSLAIGYSIPAHAAITYHASIGAFDAALGSAPTVETFDDATLAPGLNITTTVGSIAGGRFDDRITTSESTRFDFATAINGFGALFDLAGPGGSGFGLSLTITLFAGGTELLNQEISRLLRGEFWGFTSTQPFTSVLFSPGTQNASANAETYWLDDLRFGATARQVPEPASGTLAAFALAALLVASTRRQRFVQKS